MTTKELEKVFDPSRNEKKWYKHWQDQHSFKVSKKANKENYTIVMPPPNVTGKLHMGHALDNTCQDILIRHKRMQGYKALWIPGADHAGIATQSVVEKKIYKERKQTRKDLGREKFLDEVWAFKNEYGSEIINQLKTLGVSCDWDYYTFTLDAIPNAAVNKVFTALFNEGLIFQAEKIINWDTALQSAISDAEVEFKEVKGKFYHISYKVKGSEQELIVATTRPETLFGDSAVCVHPEDERYAGLIGKTCLLPISNREIPIIADEYVDRTTGTGCLKVTPAHDFNDFELGKKHDLEFINLLSVDGIFNARAPEIEGLNVVDGRKKTVELLAELDALKEVKDHTHQVGHGERSGSVIEPRVSKQWFLRTEELAARAVAAVKNGEMTFYPQTWENTYFAWLENPKDWCISRQLWWGHRIPVYTCDHCHHQFAAELAPKNCPVCKHHTLSQDQDVLDTWFSSALWPMSTLGWPNAQAMKEKQFEHFYPTATLVTGYDIIFFWVARMMMLCTKFSGDQVPFKHVYIHGIVRDKQGRKMSKSLGNGIDPIEMVEKYGCDAVRFTLASGAGHGRNLNLDPARIEGFRNFMNKIWNAFRFVSPMIQDLPKNQSLNLKTLDAEEQWILSELTFVTKKVNDSLEQYRFDDASLALYQFVYEKFCSWFIELSKPVLYKGNAAAKNKRLCVLKVCFEELLALLHPITPFITAEIYSYLSSEEIITRAYPQFNKQWVFQKAQDQMNAFIDVVTAVRNLKSSLGLSPKEKITAVFYTDEKWLAAFLFERKLELKSLITLYNGSIHKKNKERIGNAVMASTAFADIFIPASGLIDREAEKLRLTKSIEKFKEEYEKNAVKIRNEQFVSRAPAAVIEEVKEKMEQAKSQMEALQLSLKRLGF
jgi:valyl-tRNA synthetase